FVAEHCDVSFIVLSDDMSDTRERVEAHRLKARKLGGRDISVWCQCGIVLGDTPEDARRLHQHYLDGADVELMAWLHEQEHGKSAAASGFDKTKAKQLVGFGNLIVGDATIVADKLTSIAEAGIDGVLFTFVDYLGGVRRIAAEVMPLL